MPPDGKRWPRSTLSEKVSLGKALEELERPKAKERLAHGSTAPGRNASENFTEASRPPVREIVGAALGMSGAVVPLRNRVRFYATASCAGRRQR
jgi:hypothetical protein